ncbi:MAG: hypothetical protein AVDCRST_MAG18-46, partial [uncultured Thermomicrobiales bacterium]
MLDLGITPALITSLGYAFRQGDHGRIQKIVSTALSLYLGLGLIGGTVLALLVPWMVTTLLRVPDSLAAAARFALYISTISFAVNMWFAVFNAIPTTQERYDLVAARMVGMSSISQAVMIAYLWQGGNLQGMMLISLLTSLCGTFIFWLISRKLLPEILFRPGFDKDVFRELSRFSAFKFAGTVGGVLSFRFDQFVIGTVLGVSGVALYAVPSNVTQRVFSILGELTGPLYPRVSRLRGESVELQKLFLRASRLVAFASVAALVPLFMLSDLVLTYWINGARGREIAAESSTVMHWLIVAFFIQALAAVSVTFCEALGKPEINNSFSIASALIHIPLALVLIPHFGLLGAAVALFLNSITQTVSFVLFTAYHLMCIKPWELLRDAFSRPFLIVVLLAPIGYLSRPIVQNTVTLLGVLLALAAASIPLAILTRTIQAAEYASVGRILARLPVGIPGQALLTQWCRARA